MQYPVPKPFEESLKEVGSMKGVSILVNLSQPAIARIFDQVGYTAKTLPRALSLDEFRGNAGGIF
jgi:transposase